MTVGFIALVESELYWVEYDEPAKVKGINLSDITESKQNSR